MNRYKVTIIKKYDFELDGYSESDVRNQVDYILKNTIILDLPYTRKRTIVKIKKVNKGGYYETDN